MHTRCPQNPGVSTFSEKIILLDHLPKWRREAAANGLRLVVTNGCFDLLHLGHITYLEKARQLGDLLLVGVNGDASVRALKGAGRPLNPEGDRAALVAALMMVDAVSLFPEVSALHFLQLAKPDVYVKGGDYKLDTLDAKERSTVESEGGEIVLLPIVAGRSTTEITLKLSGQEPVDIQ